jgi:sulfur carrier protein ThiS
MTVTVRTGAWARRFVPEASVLTLIEGATISIALEALPIPSDEIGLAVIGDRIIPRDTILQDGDILEILPIIIGG